MSTVSNEEKALRWACRRGMLELDLLFSQFMDEGFASLTPNEIAQFKELLKSTDQDLFAWLMWNVPPENPDWQPIIQKIREYIPCKFA